MYSSFYHWLNSADGTRVICSNQKFVNTNFFYNNAEETVPGSLYNEGSGHINRSWKDD